YTDPYQIVVHRDRLRPFVTDLRRRYDTLPPRPQPTVSPDAAAPKVFISYTHEDRDAASEVFRLLRGQGLQPWMDRERLTAGDCWDPEIARMINDADYFVSLQSAALCQRLVAYVNQEIALATRRALKFRRGTRFLIPLRVT